MNKILLALLMVLPGCDAALAAAGDIEKAFIENRNILTNPSFLNGEAGWEVSTGSFSVSGSGLDSAATWDASATGQTFCSSLVPVPASLDRNNGYFRVMVQMSGASSHQVYVSDGTSDVSQRVDVSVSNGSFPVPTAGNFVFPATGSVQLCIESNADEPSLGMFKAYLGDAANITEVSQAAFVGSLRYPGTTNCSWAVASATYASFPADADCSVATVTGELSPPDTKIPAFKMANAQPGHYYIVARGTFTGATNDTTGWQLYDGTTSSDGGANAGLGGTGNVVWGNTVIGEFTYTTAQTDLQIEIRGFNSSTDTINLIANDTRVHLDFAVYRYPLQSQIAIKADQTNRPWTSYTPTFTGYGTVSDVDCRYKRQGEDMLLRCRFTGGTSTAVEARMSLPDSYVSKSEINTLEVAGVGAYDPAGNFVPFPLIEPSVSYITFGIQSGSFAGYVKQNGNDLLASGSKMSFNARVPIEGWDETYNTPLVKFSVVTSSNSVIGAESARIDNNGTATIGIENGDWIASVSRTALGLVDVNVKAGIYSSTPVCVVGEAKSGSTAKCELVNTTTKDVLKIACRNMSGGAFLDWDFTVVCPGQR
jgi:hypothetical protein